ncbi:carbohydrate ABC transporter permease [Paenibacillus methanolicus]|uniref:Multiple sugar transport system permease protein n=1 Tax=Paenibacillus methanolicus TaxID=582686 RepID=A0A5S5CGJ7_9BACL|nr:sugar ABC transporter permease [Paenibacillus methanolicus]TYP78919.1 multiple sugar transport system permease protein [Paenibacillus methanolicus]
MPPRGGALIIGKRRMALAGVLFALPSIIGLMLFVVIPMVSSLVLSFTDYRIVNTPKFIGFDNYTRLFDGKDPYFYNSLWVTFKYVILRVPLGLLFSFIVALLLNQEFIKGKSIFRTIFYLPVIVPAVASSMIWIWLFSPDLGLINNVLSALHLPTFNWLDSEVMVVPSIVLMSLWGIGSTVIIFLAGLQGVPRSLYEAATVDGAGAWTKFRNITVPMMTPIIFFNLIMGSIGAFQVFTEALIMTQGGPNNASLFYNYYIYREAFQFGEMGHASAIAWILFLIILAVTAIFFRTSKAWVFYESEVN